MAHWNSANSAFQQNTKSLHETAVLVDNAGLPIVSTNIYGKSIITIDDDTVQNTSKNRRKISSFEVTDFVTFTSGKESDVFDELIVGSANSAIEPYLGMVKLEVGSDTDDSITRQSRRVQRYIPGRQNEFSTTFIFGDATTGVRRRIGLFDDEDGLYFEDGGDGTYYVATRRNTANGAIDTRVARENWNVDKLDGNGPSGIVFDPTAIQLIIMEYDWYGSGQVEFKFTIDNNSYPIHQFTHANKQSFSWASKAELPVRVELTNFGGASGTHVSYQGSHSFSTEGVTAPLGRQRSISTATSGLTLSTANQFYPLVAIRLKTSALNSVIIPDEYAGATLDNSSIFIRSIEGATIIGGTWVSFNDDSPIEYNITATSFTGGTALGTNFVSAGNMGDVFTFPERSITQLQRSTTTTLADTASTFLIAGASTLANKDGWASLGWIEVR